MASDSVHINWSDFELRKHFECPVCLEEPQNVVYQCRMGGHIICKDCYVDLINKNAAAKCPVCRTPLPSKRFIRNNFFERLVASLKDISGLKVNPTGNETLANDVSCEDSQHFGNRDVIKVNLCRLLGFLDSNFGTSSKNTKEAVKHLVSQHGCILSKSDKFKLKLPNFKKSDGKHDDNEFWTPVIVELKERQGFLLIMTLRKKGSDSVGCFSLFLPFHNKTELSPPVEVEIVTKTEEASRQSFIQNPTTLQKLQAFSSLSCPFHYQMSMLSFPMMREGALLVTCQVRPATQKYTDEQFNLKRIPKTIVRIDKNSTISSKRKAKAMNRNKSISLSFSQLLIWTSLALCAMIVGYLTVNTDWKSAMENLSKNLKQHFQVEIDLEIFKSPSWVLESSLEEYKMILTSNPSVVNFEYYAQFAVEQMGADVNCLSYRNHSVLHIAAQTNNVAAVEYFLEKGLNVNVQDDRGNIPLHHVVILNFRKHSYISTDAWNTIQFLLKNGADCNIKSVFGTSALPIHYCYQIMTGEMSRSELNEKLYWQNGNLMYS